jgi:hypothetical protein
LLEINGSDFLSRLAGAVLLFWVEQSMFLRAVVKKGQMCLKNKMSKILVPHENSKPFLALSVANVTREL